MDKIDTWLDNWERSHAPSVDASNSSSSSLSSASELATILDAVERQASDGAQESEASMKSCSESTASSTSSGCHPPNRNTSCENMSSTTSCGGITNRNPMFSLSEDSNDSFFSNNLITCLADSNLNIVMDSKIHGCQSKPSTTDSLSILPDGVNGSSFDCFNYWQTPLDESSKSGSSNCFGNFTTVWNTPPIQKGDVLPDLYNLAVKIAQVSTNKGQMEAARMDVVEGVNSCSSSSNSSTNNGLVSNTNNGLVSSRTGCGNMGEVGMAKKAVSIPDENDDSNGLLSYAPSLDPLPRTQEVLDGIAYLSSTPPNRSVPCTPSSVGSSCKSTAVTPCSTYQFQQPPFCVAPAGSGGQLPLNRYGRRSADTDSTAVDGAPRPKQFRRNLSRQWATWPAQCTAAAAPVNRAASSGDKSEDRQFTSATENKNVVASKGVPAVNAGDVRMKQDQLKTETKNHTTFAATNNRSVETGSNSWPFQALSVEPALYLNNKPNIWDSGKLNNVLVEQRNSGNIPHDNGTPSYSAEMFQPRGRECTMSPEWSPYYSKFSNSPYRPQSFCRGVDGSNVAMTSAPEFPPLTVEVGDSVMQHPDQLALLNIIANLSNQQMPSTTNGCSESIPPPSTSGFSTSMIQGELYLPVTSDHCASVVGVRNSTSHLRDRTNPATPWQGWSSDRPAENSRAEGYRACADHYSNKNMYWPAPTAEADGQCNAGMMPAQSLQDQHRQESELVSLMRELALVQQQQQQLQATTVDSNSMNCSSMGPSITNSIFAGSSNLNRVTYSNSHQMQPAVAPSSYGYPSGGGTSTTAVHSAAAPHPGGMVPGSPTCSSPPSMGTPLSTPTKGCVFCKNNSYHSTFYKSHVLKDERGHCSCPVLRTYVCPLCRGTGDAAHTLKYCPLNTVTRGDPIAAGLPPGKVTNWRDVANKMAHIHYGA